jgi:predicted enzyme related to lactoylglutathione lyase
MNTRDEAWPDGHPCWVDLGTSDRAAAWEFYRDVMGWEITDTGEEMGHYGLATVGGRVAAGLMQAGNMPGAGIAGEPGAMTWHDLMTRDPQRAREFYSDVFGWSYERMDDAHDYTTVPATPRPARSAPSA